MEKPESRTVTQERLDVFLINPPVKMIRECKTDDISLGNGLFYSDDPFEAVLTGDCP